MPRKVRAHASGETATLSPLTPKSLTKKEFGKRLYTLMLARGWHQSELARQSGLPRDSISVYVRGKSLPTPVNLDRLAETFGISKEELLPNYLEGAIEDDDVPAFEMKSSASQPGLSWVRVNRLVTTSTAVKIAGLLDEDNASERVRGG